MGKISREKGSDGIHFKIDLGESGLVKDVFLTEKDHVTVDASAFGKSRLSNDSKVYTVETNDAAFSSQVLWEPSEKTLSMGSPMRKYKGSSLTIVFCRPTTIAC